MNKNTREATHRRFSDLDLVTAVRSGLTEADVHEIESRLTARGLASREGARLKSSGVVRTGFVADQALFEDGRYAPDAREEGGVRSGNLDTEH